MSPSRPVADAVTHIVRADRHLEVAKALHEAASDEWAAVCYFYSAYHTIKAALSTDPVFNDVSRLARIDVRLTPEDRSPRSHQARSGSATPGLNEIVNLFYPSIRSEYRLLHVASVQVRYNDCLLIALDQCKSHLELIRAEYDAGSLITQSGL